MAETTVVVRAQPGSVKRFVRQQIPDEILHDARLNETIKVLPLNYNFEIHKTIWRIRQSNAKHIALQFPEGLLMYACTIADILEEFAEVEECFILGDVTYGACCVDDYSAKALGADFLVHYGHSCLVPVDVTSLPCLYIFVEIQLDLQHLVDTIKLNFKSDQQLILAGTIQFSSSLHQARQLLSHEFPALAIPKVKPLSPGEVLGCTAPVIAGAADAIVFVADGRFHLEAIMIANPLIPAFRYDPYGRQLIREHYDHEGMKSVRKRMIERAAYSARWGVVLGTLGRQGNPRLLGTLTEVLQRQRRQFTTYLLSEVTPTKLAMVSDIDVWVQIACPRLSIDWGEGFKVPTLTPYEALVALGEVPGWWEGPTEGPGGGSYPMDYYAQEGGRWNSTYHRDTNRARAVP